MKHIDDWAGRINQILEAVFFLPVGGVPLVIVWLIAGATFLTLFMQFINFRGFRHAIDVMCGKYDHPEHAGEVSHFQALAAALSGTLGLGNIAGVAIAICQGGPGATLWMIVAGLIGMSAKFAECTLGQKYRVIGPDGTVTGGAMYYLSEGLKELRLPRLGKVLAVSFCILCMGGALGGGNSFQVNQSLNGIQESVPFLAKHSWIYGLVMTVLVGVVIIGGIRRIGATAEKLVPFMCVIYVAACVYVLAIHWQDIPAALLEIWNGAFNTDAAYGGVIGSLVVGFKRAAFSNEAGTGSAAIAHSAARTDYPVREGIVALLEPFIDTVVVCTMTALVIVITGAYTNPEYADLIKGNEGSALTSRAISETLPWFRDLCALCVFLFAYATLISWFYYGERCATYLFGRRGSLAYRGLYLVFTFLGSIISAKNVLNFGDLMILGMAFPNMVGVLLLCPGVKRDLQEYWAKYQRGEFETKQEGAA